MFPSSLKMSNICISLCSVKPPPFHCLTALRCSLGKETRKKCTVFILFECVSPLTNEEISVPVELPASSQVLPNKYISLEDDFLQLSGKLQ